MSKYTNRREVVVALAEAWIGKPYIWGGDDIIKGFDCSGLVVELLQSVGLLSEKIDLGANSISNKYKAGEVHRPGNLIFYDWNKDGYMDHVVVVHSILNDGTILCVGASGGNSSTKSRDDAIRQNAYIKLRPIWPNWAKVCDPFI